MQHFIMPAQSATHLIRVKAFIVRHAPSADIGCLLHGKKRLLLGIPWIAIISPSFALYYSSQQPIVRNGGMVDFGTCQAGRGAS